MGQKSKILFRRYYQGCSNGHRYTKPQQTFATSSQKRCLESLIWYKKKVLLEEGKTKLKTGAEDEEVKCDFRIEKETKKRQTQTDGKEYIINRKKNNSENNKDGSNKDSKEISEEKQELSDSNIAEDSQNAEQ